MLISMFLASSCAFFGVRVSTKGSGFPSRIFPSRILALNTSRMVDSSWLPMSQFRDSSRRHPENFATGFHLIVFL